MFQAGVRGVNKSQQNNLAKAHIAGAASNNHHTLSSSNLSKETPSIIEVGKSRFEAPYPSDKKLENETPEYSQEQEQKLKKFEKTPTSEPVTRTSKTNLDSGSTPARKKSSKVTPRPQVIAEVEEEPTGIGKSDVRNLIREQSKDLLLNNSPIQREGPNMLQAQAFGTEGAKKKVQFDNEMLDEQDEQARDRQKDPAHPQAQKELRRLRSSQSVIFEFGDDEKNEEKLKQMGDKYFFAPHEVTFSIKFFLTFLVYHMLFYAFIGVFVMILAIPFKKMRQVFKNMRFTPECNRIFIMQIMFWINTIMVVFSCIFYNNPLTFIPCLIMNLLSTFTRASNIASKYATFSPKLIEKYYGADVSEKDLVKDFLLGDWRVQGMDIVEDETTNAILRNDFDESIFMISFLDKLNQKVENDITELENDGRFLIPPRNEVVSTGKIEKKRTYFSGRAIFYVLVRRFNTVEKRSGGLWIVVLCLTALWAFSVLFIKAFLGLRLYNSSSIVDTISFYLNIFISGLLFFLTNFFFTQANVDINRMIYIMNQLSHMISTHKRSDEVYKLLPTMNIFEGFNLSSWKILRRIAMDYGKRFFFRHELYLPVVFILATGCLMLMFTIIYLYILDPTIFPSCFNVNEMILCLLYWSFIFYYLVIDLLWGFSKVNEFFEIHTLKLYNVKQILNDLIKYQEHYFAKYGVKRTDGVARTDLHTIFMQSSASHVHGRLAKEISEMLGDRLQTDLIPMLEESINAVDTIIQEIQVDQAYQCITILGFNINYAFVGNLLVILMSICFTIYQFVMPPGTSFSIFPTPPPPGQSS